MRSLNRDKCTVYISQPLPQKEILDDDGIGTGIYASSWDDPVELHLNLKPITDQAERQAYGTDVKNVLKAEFTPFDVGGYDIVEKSAVWIGVEPNGTLSDEDPAQPMNYNYTVEQVLDTGNQITVYFEKVAGAAKA